MFLSFILPHIYLKPTVEKNRKINYHVTTKTKWYIEEVGGEMKNLNGELILFLQAATGEEDLEEIGYSLLGRNYQSLRLVEKTQSKKNFYNTDFIFNNQQYKIVATRKLPLFFSSSDEDDEEMEDYEE